MMLHSEKYIKFPFGFWSGVQQLGIAPAEIARQARLPLAVTKEPKVSAAEYFAVWQAFGELSPDIAEGITGLVTSFETVHYPPDVLATYHARDYRDALHRMARYKQMCPPEQLVITEADEECRVELQWQHSESSIPQILIGVTLAYLLELGRRGTGQAIKARAVEFSHPAADATALEAYFGCPVQTGTGRNRLILRRSDLGLPFTTYNEELLAILTPALDRTLNEQQASPTVAETVKWIIRRSLMGGHYDIQAVARELNLSDRTLQRRLREEGTSFKALLTQARHEQAREYLADPSLEIKEVACLVGYEDQNSFYRAFRVWEGVTPARWRLEHTVQQEDGVYGK